MDWELRGCKVCEAPKKHLTCPQCFHNTVTFDKTWRKLAAARQLRAEAEEQVTAALQSRVSCRFDGCAWLCTLLPTPLPSSIFEQEASQQQQRELRHLQERISEARLQAKISQEQTKTSKCTSLFIFWLIYQRGSRAQSTAPSSASCMQRVRRLGRRKLQMQHTKQKRGLHCRR